ncbi:2-C-methyl-D-erythritol 2,4-cyclodiphosphate synthase [Mycoplasma sp. P36-A1]|uniref:2-C-methyl-D-erythritol 2,4-cyclodiphosphate synthase n=1 Tax=Mycoplasma sp. P36-A1 TaxID=3252900 RepID=UPI003C2AF3BA
MNIRIGQSTDIHQLLSNEKLILGGVEIESDLGTVAHSDGDILVHAITESIIGALGKGDLGTWFSDEDNSNKNRSSLEMLKEVVAYMKQVNYSICNIDTLILVEKPKIKKYSDMMKTNICKVLEIENDLLNIKATRGEKIGFVGRREGIVAQAVTLLVKNGEKQ